MVKKGDLLAQVIDPGADYRALLLQAQGQLDRDQALLANARIDFGRYQAAYDDKSNPGQVLHAVTEQQMTTQQALVEQDAGVVELDEGNLAAAQINVDYTRIVSPIDGRVGLRLVDAGNIVVANGSTALATITQLQPITVIFTIAEDDLSRVTDAKSAPQTTSCGWTRWIANSRRIPWPKAPLDSRSTIQINPDDGHLVRARATFPNSKNELFPNQFVNTRLLVKTLTGVNLAPTAAVQRNSDAAFVYSGRASPMGPVKSDRRENCRDRGAKRIRRHRRVNPGDKLVTDGFDKLQSGVKVAERAPKAASNPRTGDRRAFGAGREPGVRRIRPNRPQPPARRPANPDEQGRMNPSRPFILRPIATSLLMVALLLVGIIAYWQLPIAALPEVDYPTMQVLTFYPGASPDVIASAVTAPLERQLGEVPGLNQMLSTSSEGASVITLQFALSLNIDVAEQDVQEAINAAQNFLPPQLPMPPVYNKVNPADAPILTLALSSDSIPLSKVEDYTDTRLAEKISQLPGVGAVTISGGQKPAVRVQVNPTQLASYGLNLEDVHTMLTGASLDSAKGSFDGSHQNYQIGANDQLTTSDDYRQLVLSYKNGTPVMLKDVANVVDGVENAQESAWMNRTPAVIVNIQRQPGANIIQVVDRIKALLPKLRATIPPAIKIQVLTDRTTTVRASVADVEFELMLCIALVVAVIFLFLRTFAATIIPSIAVPLSLIGTFGAMEALGFSLNNLTLMALTISTGFVVDDAIVMIENITRYVEQGEAPLAAALKGAEQIGFTIMSLTVSLIAVMIPLLFMGDITGRLFREFAVTLSVTILISAVVSLTLTPMLCAKLLHHQDPAQQGRFYKASERVYESIVSFYGRTLDWVLEHRTFTLIVAVATLVVTILLYIIVPKGFFPVQDTGEIQGVTEADQSVSFPEMARLQQQLAAKILQDPAVESLSSFIGVDGTNTTLNSGRIQINLKPLAQRGISASDVIRRLQTSLQSVDGIAFYMQPVQDISVEDIVSRTEYQYSLQDPDATELSQYVGKFVEGLKQLPELTDVASDLQTQGRQASLSFDRLTAARLGITPQNIDDSLYDSFGQRQVSTVFTQLNQYHVILEVAPEFQVSPDSLHDIYLKSSTGAPGPAQRGHPDVRDHRADPHRPHGAVPLDHRLLQPGRPDFPGRRGQGDRTGGEGPAEACGDGRFLPGDGPGVRQLADERTDPDPERAGHGLYRAGGPL